MIIQIFDSVRGALVGAFIFNFELIQSGLNNERKTNDG
jgi:hypothetical protein